MVRTNLLSLRNQCSHILKQSVIWGSEAFQGLYCATCNFTHAVTNGFAADFSCFLGEAFSELESSPPETIVSETSYFLLEVHSGESCRTLVLVLHHHGEHEKHGQSIPRRAANKVSSTDSTLKFADLQVHEHSHNVRRLHSA